MNATEGELRETHVDEDGLRIPEDYREFDSQIVFRTPRSTIQHFGSEPVGPYYPMVGPEQFQPAADIRDARNPELAPNRVSIKPQGEPAEVFEVEVQPEVRGDGGHHEGIEITNLPYQCRVCGADQPVYVDVECLDGDRVADRHNLRLIRTYCDGCHTARPFVLAVEGADAARDEHPIQAVRDLEAKRQGKPLRADGGKR
jgi:hypothetical protein